jgi:nicotinate-nucleotide pyrophosphorylase (carboxylating)
MPVNWHSEEIEKIVRNALAEDIGPGDASTAATTPPRAVARAHILARQTLVCAGLPLAENVFRALDPEMEVVCLHADGSLVEPGTDIVRIEGNARAILTGERTALNFLAHLCGIATLTRRFVEQLATTKTRIRDTRKTTPGLRALEKYAVKTGGGANHRFGLYDAILLKENHIALAGGIKAALDKAHTYASPKEPPPRAASAYDAAGLDPEVAGPGPLSVQVEVRDERELREALEAGAESVLLDNMTPARAAECVKIARGFRSDCVIEISGGITLDNARAYAETGADFLSSGMLTHSAPAANLTLLVDNIEGT